MAGDWTRVPRRLLTIGGRLTLSFGALALLMGLGSLVALRQLQLVRRQGERLHQVDLRAQTALRVHADILTFSEDVGELLGSRQVDRFVAQIAPRREALMGDIDRALEALGPWPPDLADEESMRLTLETVRLDVPPEYDAIMGLARAGEWAAIERRLDTLKRQGVATASLVEEIAREVGREQAATLENMRRVQGQAIGTLALTGVLTLLTAILLGVFVTRSITRPLRRLDAGARALARGDFQHVVAVEGDDELANLGSVFNQTAARLRELYGELRGSEEHFRTLIENASDLIFVVGRDGAILYVSPSCRRVVGYEPDALVGRNLLELVESGHVVKRLRVVFSQTTPDLVGPLEMPFRHSDGSTRILEAIVNNLLDHPAVASNVINCRDVTERQQAEGALRRSEERYRALYEDTPSMYFTVDPAGVVRSVNRFGATYLGYTVEELMGRPVLDVFVDEDRQAAFEQVARCLADPERVFEWRLRKRRKDGSLLWVKETARAVKERDGRLVVLIVCEDITQRVRGEQTESELRVLLENAAVEWELTFDAIEAPIVILNARGRIARFNRAARDLAAAAGCPDMVGRSVADVAPGEPWWMAGELGRQVAESRASAHSLVREPPTGRTWDLTAEPGTGPADDERVIVVARDVTRVAELQESLRRSETMSAMGMLVAGVAHEVRNPLFAIGATLDALELRLGGKEEHRPFLRVLRGELDRLGALMRDLLAYGKPAREKPAPGDVGEVLAEALAACRNVARAGEVRMISRVAQGLPAVLMDRQRMVEVFENLLQNAIQHSPAGAVVTVEATRGGGADASSGVVAVSDSGPGIAPDDFPKLFEPFFSRRRGGTGLGLAIVRRIVEDHAGSVRAANRPEGGAVITVTLPAAHPATGEAGAA